MIAEHRLHDSDTGSPEVQVAIFTKRITQINDPPTPNQQSHHLLRLSLRLVRKRCQRLTYRSRNDSHRYPSLISKLGIRR